MFWDVETCDGGEKEEGGREGSGRRAGFCSAFGPFGSPFVFNFSCLLLLVVPLKFCYMLYYFRPIGLRSLVS